MHYRNGREAKNGDKVVWLSDYGTAAVGILYDAQAETTTATAGWLLSVRQMQCRT